MTGATSAQARVPRSPGGGHHDAGHLWPRDFGKDGVSGLVSLDRAMRARDVSQPTLEDELEAAAVVEGLLARIDGRRPRAAAR